MMFSDFITAFSVIFLAEIGDRTQLMAMSLQTEYKQKLVVLMGAICSVFWIMSINLLIGVVINDLVNPKIINFLVGILFLVYAFFVLRAIQKDSLHDRLEYELLPIQNNNNTSGWYMFLQDFHLTSLYIFFNVLFIMTLAIFSDTTHVLFISLIAHQNDLLSTYYGGIVAMILVNIFGVLKIDFINRHMSQTVQHVIAFCVFLGYGVIVLIETIWA